MKLYMRINYLLSLYRMFFYRFRYFSINKTPQNKNQQLIKYLTDTKLVLHISILGLAVIHIITGIDEPWSVPNI